VVGRRRKGRKGLALPSQNSPSLLQIPLSPAVKEVHPLPQALLCVLDYTNRTRKTKKHKSFHPALKTILRKFHFWVRFCLVKFWSGVRWRAVKGPDHKLVKWPFFNYEHLGRIVKKL
jgi:hypothetical protein